MDGARRCWSVTTPASPNCRKVLPGGRSAGARLATPYWMYLLASALDVVGRHAEASAALDEALAHVGETDERWFECDLYVLKGSLMARACRTSRTWRQRRVGDGAEAERYLRRAHRAATRMQSPSLRLRAANALGRLRRDQGKTQEIKNLVWPAYNAFTEGSQTADLVEARALLAGVSQ